MPRHRLAPLAPLALSLAIAQAAQAASLTPPNLVTASSLASPDLLLVWPYASGGPLEAMSWATFTAQMQAAIGAAYLKPANNLSDVGNQTIARTNLGLGTAATVNTGNSGATLCLANAACTISGVQTHSAEILAAPSSNLGAGLNLVPGAPPTSPSNGDVWATPSGLFSQIGGVTQEIGSVQSGTWTPTLSWVTPGTSSWSYSTRAGHWHRYGSQAAGYECHVIALISATPTLGTASGNLQISTPGALSLSGIWDGQGVVSNVGGFKSLSGGLSAFYAGGSQFGMAYSGTGTGSNISTSNVTSSTNLTFNFDLWAEC